MRQTELSSSDNPHVKMKFLVVLAVAVACATADVLSPDYNVPIVKSSYDINPEGNAFQYLYEAGNGIAAHAEGVLLNANSNEPALEIRGSYSYTSPDGTPVQTDYVAGPNGFTATGSHIPVPPAIPELIQRSLDYIAAHPPQPEKVYKP